VKVRRPGYDFEAIIARFADGDTVLLDIELGFDITTRQRCRIVGIESWETDSPDRDRALAAAAALTQEWHGAKVLVTLSPRGRDRYNRARVSILTDAGDLASLLVHSGRAWWSARPGHRDFKPHNAAAEAPPRPPVSPTAAPSSAENTNLDPQPAKTSLDVAPGCTIKEPNT
jgi:endonuclease YncB( thermonuclease family)